jgi:tyramine---L-glutamate ligase
VRVLVAEFVTAGGLPPRETPASLLREGLAMHAAAAEDLAALAGVEVVVLPVTTPADGEMRDFPGELDRALAGCDAALVIAPEFDGHLLAAHRVVARAGVRWLGCSARAIALCGDKWRLHEHLRAADVRTIPTRLAGSSDSLPWPPPWVVKPRDGAGSLGIETIRTGSELADLDPSNRIVQPRIPGRARSVAVLVDADGRTTMLPVAEQRLSEDGRFAYQGGHVPVEDPNGRIAELATRAVTAVSGLRGYVGIDVVVPQETPDRPLVIEINPRLTTSYLGYRMLADENLMQRLLGTTSSPIRWRSGRVEFDPDGSVERIP